MLQIHSNKREDEEEDQDRSEFREPDHESDSMIFLKFIASIIEKAKKVYTVRESNPCRIEIHLMATMHDTVSPTVCSYEVE